MKTEKGLVTVVICAYNAGEFLRPALLSVLAQTYKQVEIIVVDDGSTDDCMTTISDIDDPRVRILRQPNRGKSAALNHALSELRGEYYAIQDADDLSHPTRIEKQVACLRNRPDLAAVFCGHELILNGKNIAPRFTEKDCEQCRCEIDSMTMPAHDPTAMYRVSLVADLRYDEELAVAEGYDYLTRVGERSPIFVLGECLYSYRIHANTLTTKDPAETRRFLRRAAQKVRDRRRSRGRSVDSLGEEPAAMSNRERENDIVAHFMLSVLDLRSVGRWRHALNNAVVCAALHPFDRDYYRPLVYALTPLSLVRWYRRRKAVAKLPVRSSRAEP